MVDLKPNSLSSPLIVSNKFHNTIYLYIYYYYKITIKLCELIFLLTDQLVTNITVGNELNNTIATLTIF